VRRLAATTLALAATAIWAAPALATARVAVSPSGAATVTVDTVAGADGNHGLIVEPFRDVFREDALRVRQDALGVPPIVSDQGACTTNGVFNDVVCGLSLASISVTTGDGADRLLLSEPGFGSSTRCPFGAAEQPTVRATVSLGDGNDELLVKLFDLPTCSDIDVNIPVAANGGGGRDKLKGGRLGDTLRGDGGRDELDGGGGNDVLSGGAGPDDITDTGGGVDLVQYDERVNPVRVTPFDLLDNDGESGERDNVNWTVEKVSGGQGDDTLENDSVFVGGGVIDVAVTFTGNGGDDTLIGGPDDDTLLGNAGADELSGRAGADLLSGLDDGDELEGGPGADQLFGGAGNDTLDARDGEIDARIACGDGVRDTANIDLRDPAPTDCEVVNRFAVGSAVVRR
jgi:Ca2+-binding RTX toxin-like protein